MLSTHAATDKLVIGRAAANRTPSIKFISLQLESTWGGVAGLGGGARGRGWGQVGSTAGSVNSVFPDWLTWHQTCLETTLYV